MNCLQSFRRRGVPARFSVLTVLTGLLLQTAACGALKITQGGTDAQEGSGPLSLSDRDVETIVIVGTNDLHGTILPEVLKTRESGEFPSVTYQSGGVAYLASFIRILRGEFGSRLVWLDGGDEYQGSIESNMDRGSTMVRFFNAAGLDASAVGNHEFDFGPEPADNLHAAPGSNASAPGKPETPDLLGSLKARMAEARFPYLAANIVETASGKVAPFPNSEPSHLFQAGRLKVGVIGLSTLDTPRTTRAENVSTLQFTSLKDATLRESKKLRELGADLVLVTSHVGLFCELGRVSPAHLVRRPTDPQGECGTEDEMVKFLKSLPTGTIDAVVSGHTHQIVHHWVAGLPVIQGGAYGRYFNLIYLSYDLKRKKVLTDRTLIEGPIPVCPAVFQNQNDCNGIRPAPKGGRGPLVHEKFRGKTIGPDRETLAAIQATVTKAAPIRGEVLAEADRPIEVPRANESEMGNLATDAIRSLTGADVGMLNSGGLRMPLEKGAITYGDLYRSLPFDNAVVKLKVTGRELQTILRIAESGSRGFSPVSGVSLRLLDMRADATGDDLNGDGRIDPWELNRLREVRFDNGETLQPEKSYTLATIDYLVSGGDDVGWALKKIPVDRQTSTGMIMRDAVADYLRKLGKEGPINSVAHPLIADGHPRLKFELPISKKKAHARRGRRRKRR